MYSLPPLTPPQDHVLALISAGSTISQAAQSAGVHHNTVHNWIHAPHFRLALDRARESKALFWQEESEKLAAAAVDTIRALMTEASTPAGVRLKAAQFILSLAMAPPPEQPPRVAVLRVASFPRTEGRRQAHLTRRRPAGRRKQIQTATCQSWAGLVR